MKGGSKVSIEAHRHEGIFIARGKEDALVTKNMVRRRCASSCCWVPATLAAALAHRGVLQHHDHNPHITAMLAARLAHPGLRSAAQCANHCNDMVPANRQVPGESVYGEKRVSVESGTTEGEKIEYRVWNPFRSKLAASVLAGVDNVHIKPGSKVGFMHVA